MNDDDFWWADDYEAIARFWVSEHDIGAIPIGELRDNLLRLPPGSLWLAIGFVGDHLYWPMRISWVTACQLIGKSPLLTKASVFGERLVTAAYCGDTFNTDDPRELADPPDFCPQHHPRGIQPARLFGRDVTPKQMVMGEYYRQDHWRDYRSKKLADHPICEQCQRRRATQVHHTKEGYDHLWFEQDHHTWALCRRCHLKIHGLGGHELFIERPHDEPPAS